MHAAYTAAMPLELLCVDADDTLWHNMRHFDAAERAFLTLMEPFVEAGVARERLEAVGTANLKLYGYGAKSFTLSMIETAGLLCGQALSRSMLASMLEAGRALCAHPVELFDGVQETLVGLSERVRLVLVTKGDLLHQESKLAASGLGELFESVEIVSDKTAQTFARLFERHGVDPSRAGMVGDSLRSDIAPALAAGGWAAHVPHAITWIHERAPEPSGHQRYARLERFQDVPAWLDQIA